MKVNDWDIKKIYEIENKRDSRIISHLDNLLLDLKKKFPDLSLSSEDIERIYSGRNFYWMERTGIELALEFNCLNFSLVAKFINIHKDEIDGGYAIVYAEKILTELVSLYLNEENLDKYPPSALLSFIKLFQYFVAIALNRRTVSFTVEQVKNLLGFFTLLFNEYGDDYEHGRILSDNFKLFVFHFNLMLFQQDAGLLVVDQGGEFFYELQLQKVKLISRILLFSYITDPEAKKIPDLKSLYDDFVRCEEAKTEKEERAVARKAEFSTNFILEALRGLHANDFVEALTEQRWHDALQIHRNITPKRIAFFPREKSPYRFLQDTEQPEDIKDAEGYIFNTRY